MIILRGACLLATGAALVIALAILVAALVALFARTQERQANATAVMSQLLSVFTSPARRTLKI